MNILKRIILLSAIFTLSLSLFACSWEDVTVTPDGAPIVTGGSTGEKKTEPLTSNGTYGLTFDEGLDFCVVTGYHGTESDVFIPAKWNNKPVTGINSYAFNENPTAKNITITSAITSVSSKAFVGDYMIYCETDDPHECPTGECDTIHPSGWHKNWYVDENGKAVTSSDSEKVKWNCGSVGSFEWMCNEEDEIIITKAIGSPVVLNIPEKIGSRTVVAIKAEAFENCATLEKIDLPDTLEEIGSFAFRFCTSLKEIAIPEKVTVISNYLFQGCDKLEKITLSEQTTKIGDSAFQDCKSLSSIEIPSSIIEIGRFALLHCAESADPKNLFTVYVLDSEEGSKDSLFGNCGLTVTKDESAKEGLKIVYKSST